VVLLNDDAILRTPRGLRMLAKAIYAPETAGRFGMLCPSFDFVGTPNLVHRANSSEKIREEQTMLVFACVYIPRSTIDAVGTLDERFCVNAGGPGPRGYGLEDDDYSWRVRQAGLKLGVCDGVLVDHTTLKSTFRNDSEHPWDVQAHQKLFEQKWGVNPRRESQVQGATWI